MRLQQSKNRRDPKVKWPEGWEGEAQHLAKLYTRTVKGIDEYDGEVDKQRHVAKELEKLRTHAEQFTRGLCALIDGEDADKLVRMYRTCSSRRGMTEDRRGELDRLLAYGAEIRSITAANAEIVADLDGAVQLLTAGSKLDKGNRSTLALRFTIAAAASAYAKLFGKTPGRSRSDYGTFGKFVIEIINRIPERSRPRRPSPSAISEVVEQWKQRRPVAR